MSISNLFFPNDYDLYCDTLTANNIHGPTGGQVTFDHLLIGSTGPQTIPAITINNSDNSATSIIKMNVQNPSSRLEMNNSNAASTANGLYCVNNLGQLIFQCGNNNADNTGYVFTHQTADLKFGTAGGEKLRILSTGIPVSSSLNALVLNGTTLSQNQSLVDLTTAQVMQNKTLAGNVTLFSSTSGVQVYKWTLTTVGAATQSFGMPVPAGKSITVKSVVSAYVSVGALLNNTLSRQTSSLVNSISGSATWVSDYNQIGGNENVGTNTCALQHLAAALNVTAAVTGVAANTIVWSGVTEIYE